MFNCTIEPFLLIQCKVVDIYSDHKNKLQYVYTYLAKVVDIIYARP